MSDTPPERAVADDDLPPLREVIATHDLAARKSLGQNFLLDLNLTRRIARAAKVAGPVVEIGPGPGGLTRALLMEGAQQVVAIERDERCLPALEDIGARWPGRLKIISGDALEIDPRPHLAAGSAPQVVANLPYNVGTELLVRWLVQSGDAWPSWWSSLTLMFQREVAERVVAQPRSKAYGRLSVLAQWRCETKILFDVSPKAFTPPPKVTSSILQITPRAEPLWPAQLANLEKVTAAAFSQRRKMLRASLRQLVAQSERLLEVANVPETLRADAANIEQFCAIARALPQFSDAGKAKPPPPETRR
ncbi:MAG: 16S rRNA (adenine(1518)-N(6)/adenine(1519)-N(6))-dimethyltransferase RsmA [Pseudomonadota bacterium]